MRLFLIKYEKSKRTLGIYCIFFLCTKIVKVSAKNYSLKIRLHKMYLIP